MTQAFIERQFPVSKVSKESYKERKANNGQTLTGLGKWWGRKPLVLVRAAILGCLLPATDNPEKDMEIFLKIMSMDEEGLLLRKEKKFSVADLYEIVKGSRRLSGKYGNWFYETDGKVKLDTAYLPDVLAGDDLPRDSGTADRRAGPHTGRQDEMEHLHGQKHLAERKIQGRRLAAEDVHR